MAHVFSLSFCSGSVFLQPTTHGRKVLEGSKKVLEGSRRFHRPLRVVLPVVLSSWEGQKRDESCERELKLFKSCSGLVACSHVGCRPLFDDDHDFSGSDDDFDNWVCVGNVTDVVRCKMKAYHEIVSDQDHERSDYHDGSRSKNFYKDFAFYVDKVWMQKELAWKYYEKDVAREGCSAEVLVEYAEFVWKWMRNKTMAEELLEKALHLQTDNLETLRTYASLMWQEEESNAY